MIKIKALNHGLDSSDSSDSEYQVTREAEEEELNKLYMKALKSASKGDTNGAIVLLEELKQDLESDIPKVKDVMLLRRLKSLTYKNLGLLKDDLNLILDALDLDNSDFNLWITAGRKCKTKQEYILAKYCFESAYKFNQSNFIVIDNLIEIYFILNDLYNCVNMCLRALDIDSGFVKATALINECIRLMPPLMKEMQDYTCFVSEEFGGDMACDENEEYVEFGSGIIDCLTAIKCKRQRCENDDESQNKRKRLTLELDKAQLKSFEQIGSKIYALYSQSQKDFLNICTPIYLENIEVLAEISSEKPPETIVEQNVAKQDPPDDVEVISQDKDTQSTNESKKENNEKECNSDSKVINESSSRSILKSNPSLLEFVDKRRSSRVKSIRGVKSREIEDDQSIFENLMELLPESLKSEEMSKTDALDKESSSNSGSTPSVENKAESKAIVNEAQIVNKFIEKLEQLFQQKKALNIFDLVEAYLGEVSQIKHINIPLVFNDLYKFYRSQNELPCAIVCEIGKDISLDMIWACLAANEIKFNKNEALFLTQILRQISEKLSWEDYRAFVIRLLVLRGIKEFNNDFLFYALDLLSPTSQYHSFFNINLESVDDENREGNNEKALSEVVASNNLPINRHYINTIMEMQTLSIPKMVTEKNYAEILKMFFTRPESDLEPNDKNDLCEAIVNAQMWQKGIELFENWTQLTDECLMAIYHCVKTGKRARLSSKLAAKVLKCATEGKSALPWIILYWSFMSEGVQSDNASLIKFCKVGHLFLGKRGLCTSHDGEFLLCALRIFIEAELDEEVQKCFTCLFNFPLRKHQHVSSQHNSSHIDFKWVHCKDIFDYFAPEEMPEFDSNARQTGITQEMKDLFLKILRLIPEEEQPLKMCQRVSDYITNGKPLEMDEEAQTGSVTSTIYYLLADHHFKAKDFIKAKQYYLFDLALNPNRFDSWAGYALSTNYQVDQMLMEGSSTITEKFQRTAFSAIQCFERALQLQPNNGKLWIEFGVLSYNIASSFSRNKKLSKMFYYCEEPNNVLFKLEDMLDKAQNCFEKSIIIDSEDEELWLSYYMLGKVSEKKGDNLLKTLQYYEWADLCLFLDGAVYPKKISYYSPPYLSVEALEVHYRIHVSVLKHLVNKRKFSARMLRQLKLHLVRAIRSPFVTRKTYSPTISHSQKKQLIARGELLEDASTVNDTDPQIGELLGDILMIVSERDVKFDVNRSRTELIQMCLNGIKRCLSRYSAHYKSYYRLASYYFNISDIQTSRAILLGNHQNKLNPLLIIDNEDGKQPHQNFVNGLFAERKPQNFFNGIWRIPIDEIERAGNFNAHMFWITFLLIKVVVTVDDYQTLRSMAIQLYKSPDPDKRFLNEPERLVLCKLAFENCFNVLKVLLSKPESVKERVVKEIESVAQEFIKYNVYAQEIVGICNSINEQLKA